VRPSIARMPDISQKTSYLRSFRQDSVTIGAIYSGQIVALCSISPLDIPTWQRGSRSQALKRWRDLGGLRLRLGAEELVSYLLSRAEKAPEVAERVRLLPYVLEPEAWTSQRIVQSGKLAPNGIERGTKYALSTARYIDGSARGAVVTR